MATVTVHCPRCHSDEVYRHGRSCSRHERFRCRSCKRVFQLTYSYEARKPGIKEQIVEIAHTTHETRRFARELNLEPCTTAVSSPQSNGMAERFVKTMKEDYIAFMPKPDVGTALRNLAAAFTHYNETTRPARWDITLRENNGGYGHR